MSLREWWRNRQVRKAAEAELDRLEEGSPFVVEGRALPETPVESQAMGEVTGSYKTVRAMMDELIEKKREGKRAAQRIVQAIGEVPVSKTK
jgi:hypothetical protein